MPGVAVSERGETERHSETVQVALKTKLGIGDTFVLEIVTGGHPYSELRGEIYIPRYHQGVIGYHRITIRIGIGERISEGQIPRHGSVV